MEVCKKQTERVVLALDQAYNKFVQLEDKSTDEAEICAYRCYYTNVYESKQYVEQMQTEIDRLKGEIDRMKAEKVKEEIKVGDEVASVNPATGELNLWNTFIVTEIGEDFIGGINSKGETHFHDEPGIFNIWAKTGKHIDILRAFEPVETASQKGSEHEDTYIPYDERVNIVQWLARFCRHIDNGDMWLTDADNLEFFKKKMRQQFGWDTDDITLG